MDNQQETNKYSLIPGFKVILGSSETVRQLPDIEDYKFKFDLQV